MITLSVASKSDLSIIRDLAFKIWPSTYVDILSIEQLNYMLDKFYSISALENQLLDRNHVFLIASQGNNHLGFAAYELCCSSENKGLKKAKLHKLYVLPDLQSKGIGKLLLFEVEKRVINSNCDFVFLNVNRNNKAQEFYKKYNYLVIKEENIPIGNGYLMEDYVMEKKLKFSF